MNCMDISFTDMNNNNNNNSSMYPPISPSNSSTTSSPVSSPRENNNKKNNNREPETLCQYPSKKSFNRRALKKNAKLHTMCEFHRMKANRNQRRLEQRKQEKQEIKKIMRRKQAPVSCGSTNTGLLSGMHPRFCFQPLPEAAVSNLLSGPVHEPLQVNDLMHLQQHEDIWQPDELNILKACLFDENYAPNNTMAHVPRQTSPWLWQGKM